MKLFTTTEEYYLLFWNRKIDLLLQELLKLLNACFCYNTEKGFSDAEHIS
jgi:hypothetical protein